MIYKDNNKDDTTGSKLIVIYSVAITQRGASERYVPSQDWVKEKGKGVKLGKTKGRWWVSQKVLALTVRVDWSKSGDYGVRTLRTIPKNINQKSNSKLDE